MRKLYGYLLLGVGIILVRIFGDSTEEDHLIEPVK